MAEELIPAQSEVSINGETLTITPIKVKELAAFTRAISPMVGVFQMAGASHKILPELLLEHTDDFIQAVAVATRKPIEWVNELEVDELMTLAAAVIEVNADFFMTRVLPSMSSGLLRLNDRLNLGQKPTLNSGYTD